MNAMYTRKNRFKKKKKKKFQIIKSDIKLDRIKNTIIYRPSYLSRECTFFSTVVYLFCSANFSSLAVASSPSSHSIIVLCLLFSFFSFFSSSVTVFICSSYPFLIRYSASACNKNEK